MRKALVALGTVALAIAGLVGAPMTAHALLGTEVADLAVTVQSLPGTVTPVGGDVLYRVTWKNNGPAPAVNVTLTDVTTNGTVIGVNRATTPCQVSGNTVTCTDLVFASGQSRTIDVVVKTPSAEGTTHNQASVSSLVAGPAEENTANNTAGVDTAVTNSPSNSYAFVPGGECISYGKSTLCVPDSSNGVIVRLSDSTVTAGTNCGDKACGEGLNVSYIDDPYYNANNPADPITIDISFGKGSACRGLGDGSGCTELWLRKNAGDTPTPLPDCTADGVAAPAPCMDAKYKIDNSGGEIHYIVLSLSSDPDFLRQLGGITG